MKNEFFYDKQRSLLCEIKQQSPQRRDVFCEGLFLVLKPSPHMGAP